MRVCDGAVIDARLHPGEMVVMMGGGYEVSPENKGKVWVVDSEPWDCCGKEVVRLKGYEGGYATDGLVPLLFPERDG